MGIFNSIFGGAKVSKEEKQLPWIALTQLDQLADIEERSKTKTQLIFKHSTRCGISIMVLNQFIADYPFNEDEVDVYYLDLLSYRDISNEVGYRFQVLHQSPQLLIIKNGVAVRHESHGAINGLDLSSYK